MYQKRNNLLNILILYTGHYKSRFYLREISRRSKLPLKTAQGALSYLEKLKILNSIRSGKNKYFELNLENIETKLHLLQAEIHKTLLFLEKYPHFKLFLKELKGPAAILIFGSFAKFKTEPDSDIDLLIISEKKPELPSHLLPNTLHEIHLSEKEFRKGIRTGETLIKEIEENHVILNNHSYFVNAMWGKHAR